MYTDSDICIGRALTLTFATFVHMIDNPVVNHLKDEGILDLKTGIVVNYASVTTIEGLLSVFEQYLPFDKSDIVILRPDDDIGIPDHDTLIIIIKRKKDTICFYRNPWGVADDTEKYKEMNKEHPMDILARKLKTSGIIFIKPDDSMVLQGGQNFEDVQHNERINPIDSCLADQDLGACVTWNEYYIDKVKTWLADFPAEFEFGPIIDGIKSELVAIDSSVVFGDDSFTTLAEYGVKRWANSQFVPYKMIRDIFETIRDDMSDVELQLITNAYDMFTRDIEESGFQSNIDLASIFLKEALGYTMIKSDIPEKLCILMSGYLDHSCGGFIVDTTMVLISCKIRLNEKISGKRKLDDDIDEDNDNDVKSLRIV